MDASGRLPDGFSVERPENLEEGILKRPELFVATLTEKMMTFALGRGIEPFDGPAIRKIVAQSRGENKSDSGVEEDGTQTKERYRFKDIVTGIVLSQPFQMRSQQ